MWILVAVLMIVVLYPQVWMVLGSFKTQSEFLSNPALSLPETWNFDNYVTALTNGNVARNWLNSVLVTIPSVLLIVFIGVAAGYALEVMIWKGRNGVLLYILAGIMVPGPDDPRAAVHHLLPHRHHRHAAGRSSSRTR